MNTAKKRKSSGNNKVKIFKIVTSDLDIKVLHNFVAKNKIKLNKYK